MNRQVASVSADAELRAFYEACGLSPNTIEGALRQRHEKPTNFVGWERSGNAARIARAKKRNSIENRRLG
jgi:phosphoketolase